MQPHAAADRRAEAVHSEYLRRARHLDLQFHRDRRDDDGLGPICQRLLTFPQVHGLVWGSFAEASADVHSLLRLVAASAAEEHWRRAGARDVAQARSTYTSMYLRRWGCAGLLEVARLRLARAQHMCGGGCGGWGRDDLGESCGLDPASAESTDHRCDTRDYCVIACKRAPVYLRR